MMIYDVLTYLIILGAAIALGRNVLTFFNVVKQKNKSAKCSGCAGGCDAKTIKFPPKELIKSYDKYRFRL
jgi:heterodisulfide reductase subunit C